MSPTTPIRFVTTEEIRAALTMPAAIRAVERRSSSSRPGGPSSRPGQASRSPARGRRPWSCRPTCPARIGSASSSSRSARTIRPRVCLSPRPSRSSWTPSSGRRWPSSRPATLQLSGRAPRPARPPTSWPARMPGSRPSSAPASRAGPSSKRSRPSGRSARPSSSTPTPGRRPPSPRRWDARSASRSSRPTPRRRFDDADIVSTVTTSAVPVFRDGDLKPGVHINAVGSYKPHVREIPGETVRRAALFVDERRSALEEAGDILIPLREGLFGEGHIRAEIGQVLAGLAPGRRSDDEIDPLQIRRQRRRGPGRSRPGPRLKDDHGVHQHPQRRPRAGHARALELAHGRVLSHRTPRPLPARRRAGPGQLHVRSRRLLRRDLPPAGRRPGPGGGPSRLAHHRRPLRPSADARAEAWPEDRNSRSPRSKSPSTRTPWPSRSHRRPAGLCARRPARSAGG